MEISKSKFREKYCYNISELYTHAFGIINEDGKKPETIQLKFSYEQGQYVKTYPLHSSQKIIKETALDVVIELHLYTTYDFIKALLLFGEDIIVLKPAKLRTIIKQHLQKALKLYKR